MKRNTHVGKDGIIEKQDKYLIKNMFILAIGSFSSKLVAFVLVPLYTAYLTTVEYGIYDLSWSMIQLVFPILTLNVVDSSMVFYIRLREKKHAIFMITLLHVLISVAVMGIIAWILWASKAVTGLYGYEREIFIYYTVYGLGQFLFNYSKGIEKTKIIAVVGTVSAVAVLMLNIVFLSVFDLGLSGFYWANILGQGVTVAGYLICFRGNTSRTCNPLPENNRGYTITCKEKGIHAFDKEIWKQLLAYSVPMIAVTLTWWVNNALDKFVVAWVCGASATGLLAVSYKLPSILNAVQQIFMQSWHISGISEYGKKGSESFYRRIFLYLNCILALSCGLIILLCRQIARIMFSNEFYEAWRYTPLLLVSSVISGAAGYLGPILSARFDSKNMAKSGIYGALANGVLNILFVRMIGIQGAMVATVISTTVIYFVRCIAAGKVIIDSNYPLIIVSWLQLLILAVLEICETSIIIRISVFMSVIAIYGLVLVRERRKKTIDTEEHKDRHRIK